MRLFYFLLCAGIILIDQLTKSAALIFFQDLYAFNSFVSFNTVINHGVAWGLMNKAVHLHFFLSAFIIAIYGLTFFYTLSRYKQNQIIIGELLVLSGGISNIIDRLWHGGVIDFILVYYGSWCWPIFNIADIAIVIGIIWMIYTSILYETSGCA